MFRLVVLPCFTYVGLPFTYNNDADVHFQARKFLPYGFGPGSKTVIEDAASFDDDEEDYGEYQVRHSPAHQPIHKYRARGAVANKAHCYIYY